MHSTLSGSRDGNLLDLGKTQAEIGMFDDALRIATLAKGWVQGLIEREVVLGLEGGVGVLQRTHFRWSVIRHGVHALKKSKTGLLVP